MNVGEESVTITDNRTGKSVDVPIVNGGIEASAWRGLLPGIWFSDEALMTPSLAAPPSRLCQATRAAPRQCGPVGRGAAWERPDNFAHTPLARLSVDSNS